MNLLFPPMHWIFKKLTLPPLPLLLCVCAHACQRHLHGLHLSGDWREPPASIHLIPAMVLSVGPGCLTPRARLTGAVLASRGHLEMYRGVWGFHDDRGAGGTTGEWGPGVLTIVQWAGKSTKGHELPGLFLALAMEVLHPGEAPSRRQTITWSPAQMNDVPVKRQRPSFSQTVNTHLPQVSNDPLWFRNSPVPLTALFIYRVSVWGKVFFLRHTCNLRSS